MHIVLSAVLFGIQSTVVLARLRMCRRSYVIFAATLLFPLSQKNNHWGTDTALNLWWRLFKARSLAAIRGHPLKYTNNNNANSHARTAGKRKGSRREDGPIGRWEKMCFKVRFWTWSGCVCLTGRQREFVPGRRTKDGESTRWYGNTKTLHTEEKRKKGG